MLNKLTLKTKLVGLCLALAGVSALVGGVASYTLKEVIYYYDLLAADSFPNSMLLSSIRAKQRETVLSVTALYNGHSNAEEIKVLADEVAASYKKLDDEAKKYEQNDLTTEERAVWADLLNDMKQYKEYTDRIFKLSEAGTADSEKERDELFRNEYRQSRLQFVKDITKLIDMQKKESDSFIASAQTNGQRGMKVIVTLATATVILGFLFGYMFSNSLSRRLSKIAGHLSDGGKEVSTASHDISDSGSRLASSSAEQAAALQQTVASIDEISAMVSKNADNAKRSQEKATDSHQAAAKGKESVKQMVASIDEINSSIDDIMRQIQTSNQEISGIVKVINEIGAKTKVINDIVFQTKLLSFNASVEAARAGEHGKGFAVVAEEVGKLAQMSGNASKEISQMLEESISKVESTVNNSKNRIDSLMAVGKKKVESGIATAHRCGESLDEIVANVDNLSMMVEEIATASGEQSQGVQEINKAMGQLDQVTQENAAASQQAASASEKLNIQAATLHNFVMELAQVVQGANDIAGNVTLSTEAPSVKTNNSQKLKLVALDQKPVAPAKTMKNSLSAEKKVVGLEVVPSEQDPRFRDV